MDLLLYLEILCFGSPQGKGKGKGKAKLFSNGEEAVKNVNDNPLGCQIKKLRSLDVFAGCGGKHVLCFWYL